jgi:hypothetical protein
MTEQNSSTPLSPGAVIGIGELSNLTFFEDVLALKIRPEMTTREWDSWVGRFALHKELKSSAVDAGVRHGDRIEDVQLIAMDSSYDRLNDARSRGWKFMPRIRPTKRLQNEQLMATYRGFTLLGNAVRFGGKQVGQVQAEIWYGDTPNFYDLHDLQGGVVRRVTRQLAPDGQPVKRYATQAKLELENPIVVDAAAPQLTLEQFRASVVHPLIEIME